MVLVKLAFEHLCTFLILPVLLFDFLQLLVLLLGGFLAGPGFRHVVYDFLINVGRFSKALWPYGLNDLGLHQASQRLVQMHW